MYLSKVQHSKLTVECDQLFYDLSSLRSTVMHSSDSKVSDNALVQYRTLYFKLQPLAEKLEAHNRLARQYRAGRCVTIKSGVAQ